MVLACASDAGSSIIQQVSAAKDRLAQGEALQISFRLASQAGVTLTILNSDLAAVRIISIGQLGAGKHTARWDGMDSAGQPAPADAYTWRIEARAGGRVAIWEPVDLRSRPAGPIWGAAWNRDRGVITLNVPSPMRGWMLVGLQTGACMRALVAGALWPRGIVEVPWDGRDESNLIDVSEQSDWFITAFGYRLPTPCVLVTGPEGGASTSRNTKLPDPPVGATDLPWTRVRGFISTDRLRPIALIRQDGPRALTVVLDVPAVWASQKDQIWERVLSPGLRVRWFIDGRSLSEATMQGTSASIQIAADQIPPDHRPHLITVNIETTAHQVYVASTWADTKE